MTAQRGEEQLSRISTCWSKVFQAHEKGDGVALARHALLERYCRAIYRYAAAALGDHDAAEEVLQEFAYCFVRGDFQGADPHRGRFRDLVKTVLFHLIVNHQRQRLKAARQRQLPHDFDLPDPHAGPEAAEEEFVRHWRAELLDRAWADLEACDRVGGHSWFAVLRRHVEQPELTSEDLAKMLSAETGQTLTAAGVRQTLHRAREKFAALLIDEIARSTQSAQRETIEQELIDLDLLVYCKTALAKRFGG